VSCKSLYIATANEVFCSTSVTSCMHVTVVMTPDATAERLESTSSTVPQMLAAVLARQALHRLSY
jgi:hypothetical protein